MGSSSILLSLIILSSLCILSIRGQELKCAPADDNSTNLICTPIEPEEPTINVGDTAWMLTSTALVMLMVCLTMYYCYYCLCL